MAAQKFNIFLKYRSFYIKPTLGKYNLYIQLQYNTYIFYNKYAIKHANFQKNVFLTFSILIFANYCFNLQTKCLILQVL